MFPGYKIVYISYFCDFKMYINQTFKLLDGLQTSIRLLRITSSYFTVFLLTPELLQKVIHFIKQSLIINGIYLSK